MTAMVGSRPQPIGFRCPRCGDSRPNPEAKHTDDEFRNITLSLQESLCESCRLRIDVLGDTPNVIRQAAQDAERRVTEAVAKLSVPSESISTGDYVRWWPDGRDNDGRLIRDRYIDGEVVSLSPTCMRIAESHGFTERIHGGWLRPSIGSVFDTSVSPGVIRRIPRAGVPQLVKPDVIVTDLGQPWTNARATGNAPLWLKSQRQRPNGRYECSFSKSPVDPLDVKYDGATLRTLLEYDEGRRRETHPNYVAAAARRTPTQRSAVSSHWSAQLRAKVEASRKAEREREVSVRYCEEDD